MSKRSRKDSKIRKTGQGGSEHPQIQVNIDPGQLARPDQGKFKKNNDLDRMRDDLSSSIASVPGMPVGVYAVKLQSLGTRHNHAVNFTVAHGTVQATGSHGAVGWKAAILGPHNLNITEPILQWRGVRMYGPVHSYIAECIHTHQDGERLTAEDAKKAFDDYCVRSCVEAITAEQFYTIFPKALYEVFGIANSSVLDGRPCWDGVCLAPRYRNPDLSIVDWASPALAQQLIERSDSRAVICNGAPQSAVRVAFRLPEDLAIKDGECAARLEEYELVVPLTGAGGGMLLTEAVYQRVGMVHPNPEWEGLDNALPALEEPVITEEPIATARLKEGRKPRPDRKRTSRPTEPKADTDGPSASQVRTPAKPDPTKHQPRDTGKCAGDTISTQHIDFYNPNHAKALILAAHGGYIEIKRAREVSRLHFGFDRPINHQGFGRAATMGDNPWLRREGDKYRLLPAIQQASRKAKVAPAADPDTPVAPASQTAPSNPLEERKDCGLDALIRQAEEERQAKPQPQPSVLGGALAVMQAQEIVGRHAKIYTDARRSLTALKGLRINTPGTTTGDITEEINGLRDQIATLTSRLKEMHAGIAEQAAKYEEILDDPEMKAAYDLSRQLNPDLTTRG